MALGQWLTEENYIRMILIKSISNVLTRRERVRKVMSNSIQSIWTLLLLNTRTRTLFHLTLWKSHLLIPLRTGFLDRAPIIQTRCFKILKLLNLCNSSSQRRTDMQISKRLRLINSTTIFLQMTRSCSQVCSKTFKQARVKREESLDMNTKPNKSIWSSSTLQRNLYNQ
jgi:hypothetical protein